MTTPTGPTGTSVDPSTWPADVLAESLDKGQRVEGYNPASGTAASGIVVGSTGPFAQLCGAKVLEAGGNAMDAAVATSIAQITLATGCWVSFAGIFTVVYYDARTGEVSSLVAPFKTYAGETDPMTIPRPPTPSGRTSMVGGFFAGAHAAHERFGTLSWQDVMTPARWIAERGFPIDSFLHRVLRDREAAITRTPEGRSVFDPEGKGLPSQGDLFRQPQLAETLARIAEEGASYLYTGDWARKFVEVVNREGGAATLEDLASYEPVWAEPLKGSFNGYDVYGNAAPSWGGAAIIEGLNMIEAAGVGDPQSSAEAMATYVRIARQGQVLSQVPVGTRVDPTWAKALVAGIQENQGVFIPGVESHGSHSDFVVTADKDGNVAAVCHSTNCIMWGTSGLFVDGISIPDAAGFQQPLLAATTPGTHLPTPPEPVIVLKDGKLALAGSSIGAGLHEVTLQSLAAVLSGHDDLVGALNRPMFHGPGYLAGDSIISGGSVGMEEDGPEGIDTAKADDMLSSVDRLLAEELALGTPPELLMINLTNKTSQVTEDGYPLGDEVAALGVALSLRPGGHSSVPRGHFGAIRPLPGGGWEAARTAYAGGAVEGH
jgi:gamma-glutamyltranspeptidase/glutathione hydrolase